MIRAIAAAVLLAGASAEAGQVRLGMTESQVLHEMGRPSDVTRLNGNVLWSYENHGFKASYLIPFNLALNGTEGLTVTFRHGRVQEINQ